MPSRPSLRPVRPAIATTLMFVVAAGCSSDDGQPKDAQPPPADAAIDAPPAAADAGPVPPACDPAIVGTACGAAGQCGDGHVCVAVGQGGFCSCECQPDLASTAVEDEDTCRAVDRSLACGPVAEGLRCQSLVAGAQQHPNCSKGAAISADPGDEPFMLAARLSPASFPFWVTGVRYLLEPTATGATCDPGAAHRVVVLAAAGDTPPADPGGAAQTIDVPAQAALNDRRWVQHALAVPVELQSGQAVFVMIEVALNASGKAPCLHVCAEASVTGEASFAAIAQDQPPYDWKSFAAQGWPGELTVAVLGF